MKTSLRRFRNSVLLIVIALALLAVGFTGAQDEKVLIIGHSELTDSLDPARGFSFTGNIVMKATYETLVTFPDDSADTIIPALATEWAISDDGLVYTFTLRDDAVFSNGDSLTAEDVAFSFNRLKAIAGNPSFLSENIASVEAPDATTVVITLTQPDPSTLARLVNTAFSVVNADQAREQGATDAEDAAETDTAGAWFDANSAGSGPYMLESWEQAVETVLVRNPNYSGEPPYFDRIVITNMAEAATQKTALEAGDVDIATDLTRDQVSAITDPALTVFQGIGNNVMFLIFNLDPEVGGPVADPQVQMAIRLALDYEGTNELWGTSTPASVIPIGFLGAYESDHALQRDLDQARSLLADAGYADGFEITMHYPSWTYSGINWDTQAQKIQADLAEVGIAVELSPEEVGTSLEAYRNAQQGLGMWVWGPDYLDPGDYIAFLPDQLVGLRVNWTADNADETIIGLRDRAMTETDPDGRVEVFQAVQDYMQQNGPFAPFLQTSVQVGYRTDIQGQVYHPQYILDVTQLSRAE
jgi:peptide/nickel transport system substrate-binding protein